MDTNKKFKIKYTKQALLLTLVEVLEKDKKTIDHFYIIGILKNKDIDTQLTGRYYE
jgi:hypothetical protein